MSISRFLKGTTTMVELENMPSWKSHTLYKEYTEFLKDEEAQQARQQEEMADNIEDVATGGM